MQKSVSIRELMAASGVAFGTSGARGLVRDMTDRVCAAYTVGFLRHIDEIYGRAGRVAIGGDLRPSTERILRAVTYGAEQAGYSVEHLGRVPSPAVALYGFTHGLPTVMVTGSHIPADRNGMKYTTAAGEFSKADESQMREQLASLDAAAFDDAGMLRSPPALKEPNREGERAYVERYERAFGPACLRGLRLAVYGHSGVGRDILCELYRALGASVEAVAFSDEFIPVDTEAIRAEDVELARAIAKSGNLDAIVSTDGDADRPLIADETGRWFRGDVAGILTARFLGADAVACPVSCNSALERSGLFADVKRTRIGSPYVIEGMQALSAQGRKVVGYEANGGFLTASPFDIAGGGLLPPLPTRDPVIVHLALLVAARTSQKKLSELREELPQRFTGSDRDPSFATERSRSLLSVLRQLSSDELARELMLGPVANVDETDGLRITFASGEILHFRPSGNAPELRCYSEADSLARAEQLVIDGLEKARRIAP